MTTREKKIQAIKNAVIKNGGSIEIPNDEELYISDGENGEGEYFELLELKVNGNDVICVMDYDIDDEWDINDLDDEDIDNIIDTLGI